jgi:CBS domain-containing protein
MRARDLMISPPFVVTPDEPVSRAAAMMHDYGVGAIPVVDRRVTMHPVGIITDRDIVVRCAARGHAPSCPVRAHMTPRPLAFVTPGDDVEEVMDLMRDKQVRRVLVVDGGRLVGIVALADVVRHEGPRDPLGTEKVLYRISKPRKPAAFA